MLGLSQVGVRGPRLISVTRYGPLLERAVPLGEAAPFSLKGWQL